MPFKPIMLVPLVEGGAVLTIWGYETDDPLDVVTDPAYFAPAASYLRAHDLMFIYADAADRPAYGLFLITRTSVDEVTLCNLDDMTIEHVGALKFARAPEKAGPRRRTKGRKGVDNATRVAKPATKKAG